MQVLSSHSWGRGASAIDVDGIARQMIMPAIQCIHGNVEGSRSKPDSKGVAQEQSDKKGARTGIQVLAK
jgi:hypothetical protein